MIALEGLSLVTGRHAADPAAPPGWLHGPTWRVPELLQAWQNTAEETPHG